MKILYFDLIGGISGDMTVAALLDLGVSLSYLKKELHKLPVRGYSLKASTVTRGHGRANKFDVCVSQRHNFSYRQIVGMINKSRLAPGVKSRALLIYKALAKAEEMVHGHAHGDMHFHEVGDIDSVVDIVGTSVCLQALGVSDIFYSVVPVNHSLAPATMRMLEGKRVVFTGGHFENVTPTGMAICAALGRQVEEGARGAYEMDRSGFGAGTIDPADVANVLQVAECEKRTGLESDTAIVIEADIDDMNPQFFGALFEKLLGQGALDVFVTNVIMKKSRPAFLLTVLSSASHFDKLSRIILSDTTTIGLRFYPVNRLKLVRKIGLVRWRGSRVRVKISELPGGGTRIQPEYEDCQALAVRLGLAVADVVRNVKIIAEKQWPFQA